MSNLGAICHLGFDRKLFFYNFVAFGSYIPQTCQILPQSENAQLIYW